MDESLSRTLNALAGLSAIRMRSSKQEVARLVEQFDRARALFYQALDLPEPEQRSFLRDACGGDRILLAEVEELLAYHGRSGDLLDAVDALGSGFGSAPHPPEFVGSYRVTRRIGHGGMGIVYEALAPDGSRVALKVLRAALIAPDSLVRFRREARALQALDHPGIPRFLDTGLDRIHGEDVPYLVMEFVSGASLADHIAETRPGLVGKADLIAGIARAVHHAHLRGIVHRDLKPSNVLVCVDDGRAAPKVIDFGVAKFAALGTAGATFRTRSGAVLGTVGYMSPEHLSAGDLTERSDIYCLGVIAYEAFAGRLPYDIPSDSVMRAVLAILNTPARPLPRAAAPYAVDQVLQRALEKAPRDRYGSAQEFADDLLRATSRAPRSLRPRVLARRWRRSVRRARLRAAAIAILAILPVLWIGSMVMRSRAENRSVDQKLQALYWEIEEVDNIRHAGVLSQAEMRSCIRRLERVDSTLASLPHRAFFTDLRAYARFRKGELLYFIGTENRDRDTLQLASLNWSNVSGMKRQHGALLRMDRSGPLALRIAGLPATIGQSNDALVHRFLGRMDAPRYEHTWERHRSGGALEDLLRMGHSAYFFVPEEEFASEDHVEKRFQADVAEAYFNLGIALTNLGSTTDSLAAIDEALAAFAVADTSAAYREQSDPSFFSRAVGRAVLSRAELARSPSDIDSARSLLRAALRAVGSPDQALAIRSGLSESYRLEASFAADERARQECLDQGLGVWHAAHAHARMATDPYVVAGAFIEEATVRAAVAGSRSAASSWVEIENADACLDSAAALLRPEREPAFYARYLLARAAVARLRWRASGDPAERDAAEADLEQSLILLPPEQSMRHARLARAELAALAHP